MTPPQAPPGTNIRTPQLISQSVRTALVVVQDYVLHCPLYLQVGVGQGRGHYSYLSKL